MGEDRPGGIEASEREKYESAWSHDAYRKRSPGMRFLEDALQKLKPEEGASILDIGCGTGRVANELKLRGYDVTALDIAENACTEFDGPFVCCSVWNIPAIDRFEYGFCADVMEHLPTELVDQSLQNISRVCRKVYFQIANFHDHGEMVGGKHELHLTVKDLGWWADALDHHFNRVALQAEQKHHVGVCWND